MHCSLARLLLPFGLGCAVIAGLAPTQEARGQDCASLSGAARTDCYIGRGRILGEQSDIAASSARLRTSAERLRAITGGSYDPMQPKVHKARRPKSKDASKPRGTAK
jgi:hypothetical protein